MDYYRIADISVGMDCRGSIFKKQALAYQLPISNQEKDPEITINYDSERLMEDQNRHPHLSPDELEYIYTGLNFYHRLPEYQGFCLHSSAVAFNQKAVLFSGPCGTGKSTHASLWQKYFGNDQVVIINDDKPAIRLSEGRLYAYGTPWSGKTDLNCNIRVPLHAVVFLKQAEENRIRRLEKKEALRLLIYQSMRPVNRERMDKLMDLLDILLNTIPVYELECNISADAVKLVHETVFIKEDLR